MGKSTTLTSQWVKVVQKCLRKSHFALKLANFIKKK